MSNEYTKEKEKYEVKFLSVCVRFYAEFALRTARRMQSLVMFK
jgi:hypothetical protein